MRARDIGIPFNGTTGKYNAITDVVGVMVGYSNPLISDSVQTGVTAILPRGKRNSPVYAGWYALNGNGDMTGTAWITESGYLETPIMITNTNSVGIVRDAVLEWFVKHNWYTEDHWYTYPVVAECYDGILNDIYGFHITKEHAYEALNTAKAGMIAEGNVGGGKGMIGFGFKGGTGTSSRIVSIENKDYTVGVLVQNNMGVRENLLIAGAPVGKELKDTLPFIINGPAKKYKEGDGSIIVVIATDAPLLPFQLNRIAARATIGIGNVGGKGENGSGDIFIAFSTANEGAFKRSGISQVDQLSNDKINPLFKATADAVEEAIINSMTMAETMTGFNGNKVYSLPIDMLPEIMRKYGR